MTFNKGGWNKKENEKAGQDLHEDGQEKKGKIRKIGSPRARWRCAGAITNSNDM